MRKPILTRFARFLLRLCVIYRMRKENRAKRKFQHKNITKIKITMKTKTIPFDLETAKKIQAGEIDGAIKTRTGNPVRLLCVDLKDRQCIVAAVTREDGSEYVSVFGVSGNFVMGCAFSHYDLVLEVPDNEPEFKPFDKVLVRDDDNGEWCLDLYAYRVKPRFHRMVGGAYWEQCIPYEENEHLLGTTDKPKEK